MTMRKEALVAVLAVALVACGGDGWWRASGARTFEEIPAAEAHRRLAPDSVLVQACEREDEPQVPGALLLGEAEDIPEALVSGSPIVVFADDLGTARRLAARLVRSGASHVAVVRGGIQGWLAAAPPREGPSAARREGAGPDET
jgi:hypothetical protein